ncbi:MAG: ankyrin repeat domain-containing protein [Flavobacteriales bacterium]|nr:ankyrin repeat domain-containing protein [Flavobacteriales bacterium]
MSTLYEVIAEKIDRKSKKVTLHVQVVHPDAMYISSSVGFALHLIANDTYEGYALGKELDVNNLVDSNWMQKYTKGYIKSCKVLELNNEPPQKALDDYDHSYWNKPEGWLKGKLEITVTNKVWIEHLFEGTEWDSAAYDPCHEYDKCEPVHPNSEVETKNLTADYNNSKGWIPIPKFLLSEYPKHLQEKYVFMPRYSAKAYDTMELAKGITIQAELLAKYHGKTVILDAGYSGGLGLCIYNPVEENIFFNVINSGSSSYGNIDIDEMTSIGLAGFDENFQKLSSPLSYKDLMDYSDPLVIVSEIEGSIIKLKIEFYSEMTRLVLDNKATALAICSHGMVDDVDNINIEQKLGQVLNHYQEKHEFDFDDDLYCHLATGIIKGYGISDLNGDKIPDFDSMSKKEVIQYIDKDQWPHYNVEIELFNSEFLEHLEVGQRFKMPNGVSGDEKVWNKPIDGSKISKKNEKVEQQTSSNEPVSKNRFKLKNKVVKKSSFEISSGALEVIREFGLCERIDEKEGLENFYKACEIGPVRLVNAYLDLGMDIEYRYDDSEKTPLTQAVEGDQVKVITFLIEKGADINNKDGDGDTPLMTALNWDNFKSFKKLIELGADVNATDEDGYSILEKAEEEGKTEYIKLLKKNKAKRSSREDEDYPEDPNYVEELDEILEKDNHKKLQKYIEKGGDISNLSPYNLTLVWGDFKSSKRAKTLEIIGKAGGDLRAPDQFDQPLIVSYTSNGEYEIVKTLLEHGANPNDQQKSKGTSPLLTACEAYDEKAKKAKIAQLLLDHGADIDMQDWLARGAYELTDDNKPCRRVLEEHFQSFLDEIEKTSGRSIEQWEKTEFKLLKEKCGIESFLYWINSGKQGIIKGLLEVGYDPNNLHPESTTPLEIAVDKNNLKLLKMLLKSGADTELKSSYGGSPLSSAASLGRFEMVKVLLEHGANPNISNEWYSTPLNNAAAKGEIEIMEVLLSHGASVNPFPYGSSPLHSAVYNNQFEAAEYLLNSGANINAKSSWGETPLLTALKKGHDDLTLALISAGADVNLNLLNDGNPSPLILAVKKGNITIIKELIAAGADLKYADKSKKTAAHYASLREELAELFPKNSKEKNKTADHNRGLSKFMKSIYLNDRKTFLKLLSKKTLNDKNYRGDSALMVAVIKGNFDMCEALIENGADMTIQNKVGDTAYSLCIINGDSQIKELLENHGQSISMDSMNLWAGEQMRKDEAMAAIKSGDLSKVSELIENFKIDLNHIAGTTPLRIAEELGDQSLVKLLKNLGADEEVK